MKIFNGQRIYAVELNDQQLAVIHEGLMQVPYGRSAPVVNDINRQLAAQMAPADLPSKTDDELMAEHHGRYGAPTT